MSAQTFAGGVLDASVVLAALLDEPGLEAASIWFADACISAVNFAEVVSRLIDLGHGHENVMQTLGEFQLDVRSFTQEQASLAAALRVSTRQYGLSLGDRACLALASSLDRSAITADRMWANLDLGIEVKLIR